MENDWKNIFLGEVADIIQGYAFKRSDFSESGIPIIKIKNINSPNVVIDDCNYVSNDVYEKIDEKYKLQKGDVLISMTGSNMSQPNSMVGKVGVVRYKNRSLLNQRVGKLVITDSKKVDYKFLYYLLSRREAQYDLVSIATGSANQVNISGKQIKSLKFSLPLIEDQKKIVKEISSLDDKIELNNEMNKTLEQMAQAIFKSWFVDFEPFKDGEFEESELGMIPKGWKILELSKLGNIITGKTPSKNNPEHFGNEYKFITPKDINGDIFITKSERGLSNEGYEKMRKNMHYKYSIGVSCIGSDLGEVYLNDDDGFTNQQINTLTLNNYKYYPYAYICLKNMKDEFKNMASGSAVPIINKTTFSKIKIVVPSEKYIEDFYNKVDSIFRKILININQNEELNEIRDTLLPKLISGEIKL